MDSDKDGKISWEEFFTASIDKTMLLNEKNLRAIFDLLDIDGNGKITKQEL